MNSIDLPWAQAVARWWTTDSTPPSHVLYQTTRLTHTGPVTQTVQRPNFYSTQLAREYLARAHQSRQSYERELYCTWNHK